MSSFFAACTLFVAVLAWKTPDHEVKWLSSDSGSFKSGKFDIAREDEDIVFSANVSRASLRPVEMFQRRISGGDLHSPSSSGIEMPSMKRNPMARTARAISTVDEEEVKAIGQGASAHRSLSVDQKPSLAAPKPRDGIARHVAGLDGYGSSKAKRMMLASTSKKNQE